MPSTRTTRSRYSSMPNFMHSIENFGQNIDGCCHVDVEARCGVDCRLCLWHSKAEVISLLSMTSGVTYG